MRRFASVLRGLLFGVLAMGVSVGGDLATTPASNAAERDELVIGITQFPTTFHPGINAMMAKTYILGMTRRPITAYDPDWDLVCMLCTRLPTLENGGAALEKTPSGDQGIAVTYTLHEDAVWADGTPVTTEDVIFSWKVGRHPKSGFGNIEAYRRIYRIDRIDEKTFTLHVDRVTFDYNDISGFDVLPAHVDRKNFDDPAEYRHRTAFDTDTTNPGLYHGPYVVSDVRTGSHVTLERNSRWHGDPPAFRRITVRVVENTAALEANLLSGAVDMIAGELGLTMDQALSFEKRHGDRYNVLYKQGLIYEHIDLNLDNPILADRRVRRALVLSIDRERISEALFDGRQAVAHSNVNPLDWVHADDLDTYSYDPDKARKLLEEAGWTPGAEGVRRNARGDRFSLEFMTTAGNRSRERVQQVLQSMWRQAGIHVEIRNEPARVFFGETVTKREFTGLAMYAWISAPESVPRTTLHSEEIPSTDNGYAGQNYPGYSNLEMDSVIDRIEVELDRDKRGALWRRLQQIYIRDVPVIPLFYRASPYVLPNWLKGLKPTGHQFPSTYWVEYWRAAP